MATSIRLSKEFQRFPKEIDFAFMYLEKEDDMSHWIIQISPTNDSPLKKDLETCREKYGIDHICLHLIFSEDYPLEAPFIYVEYPEIRVVSESGWIMYKGVPCWELIGNGWVASYYTWTIVRQFTAMLEASARIELSRSTMARVSKATADEGKAYLMRCHPEWMPKEKKKGRK